MTERAFAAVGCLLPVIGLLPGCDPVYHITILNSATDTVTVYVRQTSHFHAYQRKIDSTPDSFNVYRIAPQESLRVGSAIGGLENDLPFTAVKIIAGKDTIAGYNEKEVIKLFDKTMFGGIQTPYNITIP